MMRVQYHKSNSQHASRGTHMRVRGQGSRGSRRLHVCTYVKRIKGNAFLSQTSLPDTWSTLNNMESNMSPLHYIYIISNPIHDRQTDMACTTRAATGHSPLEKHSVWYESKGMTNQTRSTLNSKNKTALCRGLYMYTNITSKSRP